MKTEIQADKKAIEIANKLYPDTHKDWSTRHKALSLAGQLIGYIFSDKNNMYNFPKKYECRSVSKENKGVG